MNPLLEKLIENCPVAGAIIVVVWMFLRSAAKRDKFFHTMHKENIEARRDCRESINENNRLTGGVLEYLRKMQL